jgi:nucleotide-binding universal stress UspA family protein
MFHNILWSVDPTAPAAPPLALLRALEGDADSQLRAMAVLEPFDHLYAAPWRSLDPKLGQWRRRWHSELREKMRVLLRPIAGHGIRLDYKVVDGYPTNALLADLQEGERDLLLVRTQADPQERSRIGDLVEELLLRSPVALCCVREVAEDYTLRSILVPTDFSENSASAFETAVTLAEEHGASVTLLHLMHGWGRKLEPETVRRFHATAKKALKAWRASRPHLVSRRVPIEEEILHAANPSEGILQRAREIPADLIVVASHGWTGLSGVFFGSTARRVVRGADVPVLVTRTPVSAGIAGSS